MDNLLHTQTLIKRSLASPDEKKLILLALNIVYEQLLRAQNLIGELNIELDSKQSEISNVKQTFEACKIKPSSFNIENANNHMENKNKDIEYDLHNKIKRSK